jgi:hypothetical protein
VGVAGPAVSAPGRRLRLVLAVVAGVAALLCLGGVGIVYVLYDDATKIDRGTPGAAVDNYLRAYLVNRDDTQAALFRCKSPGDLNALAALRTELLDREKNFNVHVTVSWSSLTIKNASDGRGAVETGLIISGASAGQTRSRRTENWTFGVVDEDGWRVCDAAKLP